jgi:hypothetical protein
MSRTTVIEEITNLVGLSKCTAKRIQRECIMVRDKFDEICVEVIGFDKLLVKFKDQYNEYTFTLGNNYPFVAPIRLIINTQDQNRFFDLRTQRFRTILKYITGLECLCCNSYLCKNNWTPAVTLPNIITQVEEYKVIKKNIAVKLLLDQIKLKYLNRDIDLDSWVFTISLPRLCLPGKAIL